MPAGARNEYTRWLRFQIWLAVAGIISWLAGAATGNAFVTGFGTGIMASALALRVLRGKAPGENSDGDGA
jgi:hypothetical protein